MYCIDWLQKKKLEYILFEISSQTVHAQLNMRSVDHKKKRGKMYKELIKIFKILQVKYKTDTF